MLLTTTYASCYYKIVRATYQDDKIVKFKAYVFDRLTNNLCGGFHHETLGPLNFKLTRRDYDSLIGYTNYNDWLCYIEECRKQDEGLYRRL